MALDAYFVSPTGSNTSPYDTLSKSATSPKTVVDYIKASGSALNEIYISGVFTGANDYMLFDHANHDNTTVIGDGRTTTKLSPSNYHCIALEANITINVRDIGLYSTATMRAHYCSNNTGEINFSNADFVAPLGGYDQHLIYNAGATLNIDDCRIFHQYGANERTPLTFAGDGGGIITNTLFRAGRDAQASNVIHCNSTGTIAINNCAILDSYTNAISVANGVVSLTNCIVNGCLKNSAAYPVSRTGGLLTLTNNFIVANPWDGDGKWVSGTAGVTWIDGGGNIFTNANPRFTNYPRKGFILICVDDRGTTTLDYVEALSALLDTYGFTGTYFIQISDSSMSRTFSANEKARLRALVEDGIIEIGCHSDTHSQLTLADDTVIWNITDKTLTIERAGGGTITVSGGAGTVDNFKTKTLSAIRTELVALGCTVTPTTDYSDTFSDAGKLWKGAYGEVIKEGAALSTEVKLLVDATGATGYLKAEMADPKAYLAGTVINGDGNVTDGQTGGTYVANSFGCPYNINSVSVRAAAIALNYKNLRGIYSGEAASSFSSFCTNLDMFKLFDMGAETGLKGDGTEANVRKNARAIAFAVAQSGVIYSMLSHSPTNLTIEQWGWVLDEWNKYKEQINIVSFQKFSQIIEDDWTDDLDGTFSRIYAVGDGDYHLTVATPQEIRNGGKNVGLTTDFEGNTVPFCGGFPIGPYRSPAINAPMGLTPGLGLGGRMIPPRRRRR